MSSFDLDQLEDEDLDCEVAKVLGLNVVGKALCFLDYECGDLLVSLEQNFGEEHYVYVRSCVCELFNNLNERHARGEPDAAYWVPATNKIHGHHTYCLEPIPNYSTNWYWCGNTMTEKMISVFYIGYVSNEKQRWGAMAPQFPVDYVNPYTTASTPLIAAMRSLVKYKRENSDAFK